MKVPALSILLVCLCGCQSPGQKKIAIMKERYGQDWWRHHDADVFGEPKKRRVSRSQAVYLKPLYVGPYPSVWKAYTP